MRLDREVWHPDIETQEIHEFGRRWPILLVSLFERNELGERRFIGHRSYDLNEGDES